jgi:hypothetical protein
VLDQLLVDPSHVEVMSAIAHRGFELKKETEAINSANPRDDFLRSLKPAFIVSHL